MIGTDRHCVIFQGSCADNLKIYEMNMYRMLMSQTDEDPIFSGANFWVVCLTTPSKIIVTIEEMNPILLENWPHSHHRDTFCRVVYNHIRT